MSDEIPKPFPTQLGSIPVPDLRALLLSLINETSFNINCHQIGTIVSFNAALQTAQVQINMVKGIGTQGQFAAYPVLLDCPVAVMQGGGGYLTFPIALGDPCLVLFNDRDIDIWWSTGATGSPPNSQRVHDLSDGIAIVGIRSKVNPIVNYSTTDAEFKYNGGSIKVSNKIGISNAATSLLTVLTSLINHLLAFQDTHGDTPNATTIANFTADLTSLNTLLK